MLYNAGLPNSQSGEAMNLYCGLSKKLSPTRLRKEITLYEFDTGSKPNLSNMRRFGCVAWHHNEDPKRTKPSNQGITCVFLHYEGHN